ncbi:Uncharacterised protein [Mycobacteroides abscessus subsp. abscessus]|nr:Uncharacterised protein [Mycobacteroides abscessus subsp. abscessus]
MIAAIVGLASSATAVSAACRSPALRAISSADSSESSAKSSPAQKISCPP